MNLLTYWFSPGIYKNTLRRFKWGSILYAVIMFFCVPFAFMTQTPEEMTSYMDINGTVNCALFDGGMFILPLMMAYVVPTIVALLVFNFAHSPKHGVFVHSLPATRAQNYFSTLLAAFTLMFVPVILNGIILLILSNACGYGLVLGAFNIFKWVMIQIFIMFVMFSIASAASFITGNAFAGAALNIIIHLLPIAIALIITLIGEIFLYGYDGTDPFTLDIVTHTPVVWIATNFKYGDYNKDIFTMVATYGYIVLAAVFYAAAFLLYKLRKVENCGDVIAFAAAKPIVKYTLTTITAALVLGVLGGLELVPAVTAFTVAAIICAIVYFACEMIMNKTLKVWGKYKGFFGFAVCIAIIISFCAYTSVFGYETRVPDAQDVASATMSMGYYEQHSYSDSLDAALEVTEFHKNIVENRPVNEVKEGSPLYIQYKLKNGNEIKRVYYVPEEKRTEAMDIMFGYEDYKLAYTDFDIINIENVSDLTLEITCSDFSHGYRMNEHSAPLMKAIKEDIKNISFREYETFEKIRITAEINISPEENAEKKIFKDDGRSGFYGFFLSINSNFTNTIEFLKENGYYDGVMSLLEDSMYITKTTYAKEEEFVMDSRGGYSYKTHSGEKISIDEVTKIDPADAKALINEHIVGNEIIGTVPEETYLVFVSNFDFTRSWKGNNIIEFTPETLPEYLRKYVE